MRRLAILILSLLFLMITGVLMAESVGLISSGKGIIIKTSYHFLFFVIMLVYSISHKTRIVRKHRIHTSGVGGPLLFLIILLVLSSLCYNANSISGEDFLRIFPLIVFSFNLLILYPLTMKKLMDVRIFFTTLNQVYVIFSLGLLILVSFLHLSGLSPYYVRFGYPLVSGVFGLYMLAAWLITATVVENYLLNIIFGVFVILSGSRMAICSLLFFYFTFFLLSPLRRADYKKLAKSFAFMILLFGIVLFIYQVNPNQFSPYLNRRIDVSSGRTTIWNEALKKLGETNVLLFGFGSPQEINMIHREEIVGVGAHNSFIDLSLTYGVPYALATYFIWFFYFFPRKPRSNSHGPQIKTMSDAHKLQIGLFFAITLKSLVGNTLWTNMGDALAIFVSLILLCPISEQSIDSSNITEA